jgi:hypothetical protein
VDLGDRRVRGGDGVTDARVQAGDLGVDTGEVVEVLARDLVPDDLIG